MKRHGRPIEEVALKKTLNVGIERSDQLLLWEAAIEAGATLDELEKMDSGGYSNRFLSRLMVWYQRRKLFEAHVSEAESEYIKKQSKKK